MIPPIHRNPMRPRPVESRQLTLITASCLKIRWYDKNTTNTQALCGPCYLRTPYYETHRRRELHGFFDGYSYEKYCHQCGDSLSTIRPLVTCSECHSVYIQLLNALTLEGVSPLHLRRVIYNHETGAYRGLGGLMIEETY